MNITRAISRIVFFSSHDRFSRVYLRIAVSAVLVAMFSASHPAGATIVRMETNVGSFNVELYDAQAPGTVTNFLFYVDRGDYNKSIIHRSVPGFVIQGGGYQCCTSVPGQVYKIAQAPPIANEFDPSRSNIRSTIAMAKLPDKSDSATSEWFINLADNSGPSPDGLDFANGGYTVFGRVLDPGMTVVDTIATLKRWDFSSPFDVIPLINYDGVSGLLPNNYVTVYRVCRNDDGDGACPATEDLAPGGDGNGDGIADRDQPNVTTIQTLTGGTATFSADTTDMVLAVVDAINSAATLSRIRAFESPPNTTVLFGQDMFTFTMTGVMGSAGHVVTLYNGTTARPANTHYYAYGKTLDNPTPHWYEFAYDGETGAEISGDKIILHFVDGKRGDDDLSANNSITHTGMSAVVTPNAPTQTSQSGGGCSMIATPSNPSRGGDWIMVSLFFIVLAVVRKRDRDGQC